MLDGLSIQPPRLEDAGLEDCALPPQSIMEAFSRAANSLKSRLTSQYHDSDDEDGCCIQDPGPTNGDIPDALVADSGTETLDCGGDVAAMGEGEVGGDEVVVVGGGVDGDAAVASDSVLVLWGDDVEGCEKACCPDDVGDVGVNKGFGGGKEKVVVEDEGEDEDEEKKPILVETLI